MKVKALVTVESFGLLKGEIIGAELSEQYKTSLVMNGLAVAVQDNEIMQSEVDDYQEKSYPKYFLVIKNGSLYRANVDTSATWINSEWDLKIQGA